ncbi:hypothetical protein T02_13162 [Trichinella nativa]|uniref:Uncharacterized protein n=1 Tax=Trichinella nativa TaxID=6335 RepID=A0A0V1LLB8_9BILA|nr:hypothetical protein T02_13162 [Trichinella nativa]OUC42467.1 hypothetical protein D917_02916 [Trichinella nativa]
MKQFMTNLHVLAILVTLLLLYRPLQCIEESNSLGGNRRLAIELLSHKPCRKGRWDERIRFPSSRIAELVPDPKKEFGCYKIRGEVEVFKEIQGEIQIYVRSQLGTRGAPEQCSNFDPRTKCGGTGSCIYCGLCNKSPGMNELFSLQVDGERFDCDRGIDKGTYNSIEWHFCTPTLDEFLENADIDPDFWSKHGNKGQIIFQTIQIYNISLNTLPPAKLQKVLNSGDGMIACHKLVVNYLQDG